MKKVLICGVIAAAFGFTAAHAGTEPSTFAVAATLSATCQATNSGAATVDFGPVVAFDTTPISNATADVTFKCTQGLSPTASLGGATSGTVRGLAYNLSVGSGVLAAGGSAATGNVYTFTVTGTMAAGQAGNTADPATKNHTLTITF